jgi:hypothetical protein
VGPFHHGMARPRVGDGGDGLQIWRIDTKNRIISRGQPTRGGSSASGLGEKLTTTHRKEKQLVTKCYTGGWRRLHNKELQSLNASPNIIRVIKS